MVRLVHTAYQDSKRYTAQVSTWLMQTALHYGYPASNFVRSTRSLDDDDDEASGPPPPRTAQQQKNARRKAKQKALKAAAKGAGGEEEEEEDGGARVELQGNFILKSHQYVEVATFLVEEQVQIPTELMLLIRSCIRMRNRCLRPFLADPDASTFTHAHFINVLREVSSIFEQQRNKQQVRASKKEDEPESESTLPTANRFASLEEDLSSTVDADEEMPDIQLPAAPRPAKSSVSAAKVRGDLEDTHESAIHMLLLFYADLHSVRDYIRALWADYRTGKTDLLTASVTTNTALELLRKPHDDVMKRALPFFDGDFEAAVHELAFLGEDLGLDQVGDDVESLIRYLKSLKLSPRAERRCDYFFTTHLKILNFIAGGIRDKGFDMSAPGKFGHYNPDLDFTSIDIKTKWSQIWGLSMDNWPDWVMIIRAPKDLLQHIHDNNLRVLKESAMRGIKKAPVELSPYKQDETVLEMEKFVRTREPTLLGMFHLEIFNLINFELGSASIRGLEELRLRVAQMMQSLNKREIMGLDHRRGDWTDADEELVYSMKLDLGYWAHNETPPTYMRRCYVGDHPESGIPVEGTLMERSPMMCGLLLFRLQLKYQQLSLRLANEWGAIQYAAHLYAACRHSGNSPGKEPLVWPDMDKLIEIHPDVFGGKVPENIEESQSALLRMSGTSAQMAQVLKLVGTEAALSPQARARAKANTSAEAANRTFKPLRDHTQMLPVFKNRFLGNATGTCIDVHVIESLLRDIKARQELEEAKKAAAEGSSSITRKPLRRERKHKSAKFSIPQLLAVLEAGLRSETESIRFDYVSQHVSCMKILSIAQKSAEEELVRTTPGYVRGCMDLQLCLPWLIAPAIVESRHAERDKRPMDKRALNLLVGATDAIREFWDETPQLARSQVAKLGQDEMEDFKAGREQVILTRSLRRR